MLYWRSEPGTGNRTCATRPVRARSWGTINCPCSAPASCSASSRAPIKSASRVTAGSSPSARNKPKRSSQKPKAWPPTRMVAGGIARSRRSTSAGGNATSLPTTFGFVATNCLGTTLERPVENLGGARQLGGEQQHPRGCLRVLGNRRSIGALTCPFACPHGFGGARFGGGMAEQLQRSVHRQPSPFQRLPEPGPVFELLRPRARHCRARVGCLSEES